jgi:hypothetical protein
MKTMTNRILSRGLVAATAILLASLFASDLQAQTTFTACRVPDVGAIYMIGVSGAPSACLDPSHIEFSWTEGSGALAEGSVTTTEILDGTIAAADIGADAVTSAEIADGTIVAGDVDDTSVQRRVASNCVVGSYIRAIAADGTVTCQQDSAPSILGYVQTSADFNIPASATNEIIEATCPSGTALLSAGLNRTTSISVHDSHALDSTTWRYRVANSSGGTVLVRIHLTCARID